MSDHKNEKATAFDIYAAAFVQATYITTPKSNPAPLIQEAFKFAAVAIEERAKLTRFASPDTDH